MKRILPLAAAAAILVILGVVSTFFTIRGSSSGIAFADVAKALSSIRTATYDYTAEMKNPMDDKQVTLSSKVYFLAPSHERVEMSVSLGSAMDGGRSIMILDHEAMKGLTLDPHQQRATTIDLTKIKKPEGPSSIFEMVRQLVRDGNTAWGTVKSLGMKEIDGRQAVGFRIHNNMTDTTLWADPQTARLVRGETDSPGAGGHHGVMSNFRYDMDLGESLFSIEPPAGYTVENIEMKTPVENDLVNLLRFVAEHNNGVFPATIQMSDKEIMQAMQAEVKSESEKLLQMPEIKELRDKMMAQLDTDKEAGGKEPVDKESRKKEQMDKEEAGRKQWVDKEAARKEWMKQWMKISQPITQKIMLKRMQGLMFYMTLKPENDSHYAGGGVKLGTPDRAIFWYKPTGSEKYRVIYADLSVKEMTPEEVKNLPEAKPAQ